MKGGRRVYNVGKAIGWVIGWTVVSLVKLVVKLVTWPFRALQDRNN